MKRFRFTAAETIGTGVLLLCLALPFAARRCASASDAEAATQRMAARAAMDSAAQARIDSAQARDDSIRTARELRRHQKKTRKSKNTFVPAARDRLSDTIPSPPPRR